MAKNISKPKKRTVVEEFCCLAETGDAILRAEQMPCGVPLVLWDIQEMNGKFLGCTLWANCAVEENERGETDFVAELAEFDAAPALEAIEQRANELRVSENLTVNKVEVPQRMFQFFLPKRMHQNEEERKEINKNKFLGMVAGLKNGKSLCMVMRKLERKKKEAAAKRKRAAPSKQAEIELSSEAEEE